MDMLKKNRRSILVIIIIGFIMLVAIGNTRAYYNFMNIYGLGNYGFTPFPQITPFRFTPFPQITPFRFTPFPQIPPFGFTPFPQIAPIGPALSRAGMALQPAATLAPLSLTGLRLTPITTPTIFGITINAPAIAINAPVLVF